MSIRDVAVTDFDIGIGWQTWGNYGCVKSWAFSLITNEQIGEESQNHLGVVMITVLGFYFRINFMDRQGRFWDKKQ